MKRKTRRLIFFFATVGFLVVACAVVGSLVLGRGGGGGSLQLAAPKDLQGFALSIYLNTRSGDLTSPAGKDDTTVLFTIERGESLNAIANRLQSENLIKDPDLFKRYLQYNGLDASIEAGDFELKQTMDIQQIAKVLQEGRIAELNVRIPQGLRLEEIADNVARAVPVDRAVLLNLMKDASQWKAEFEFLNDLPEGATLEGYIFPDTYSLPRDKVTARDVIVTALRNFDKQVTPQMRADLQAQGRSLFDAIRLASIVEREAAVEEERPRIAGVYLNRLNDGMALDADPTIQYALGQTRDPQTLAYGMHDSPVALLAWILERRRAWTDDETLVRDSVRRLLRMHCKRIWSFRRPNLRVKVNSSSTHLYLLRWEPRAPTYPGCRS